jgi:hypothetical protein
MPLLFARESISAGSGCLARPITAAPMSTDTAGGGAERAPPSPGAAA